MAILPNHDFSAESGIKESLFSEMSALYASISGKSRARESISFEDMSNELFENVHGRKPGSKVGVADGLDAPEAEKSRNNGGPRTK